MKMPGWKCSTAKSRKRESYEQLCYEINGSSFMHLKKYCELEPEFQIFSYLGYNLNDSLMTEIAQ